MRDERNRIRIYQPFKLPVRITLWTLWALIAVGVITVGSRSPEPNHPLGLLLLGAGLAGSGVLAALALVSPALRERLVEPEFDARNARFHFYGLLALGVVGLVMVGFAVNRLV
ncbi:MAG TPA: hypothetical protein VF789_23425 [Thermoanaerobaculia bacterium]